MLMGMLYFNNDEEQTAGVERTYEELHRKPAPPKPVARVVVVPAPPGAAAKPLIAKSQS